MQKNVDLTSLNSLRLPCQADRVWDITSLDQFYQVIDGLSQPPLVLAGLTNTVLPPCLRADVLRLRPQSSPITVDHNGLVILWSGQMVAACAWSLLRQGWQGFEYFTSLPGTIGGALYNNSHYAQQFISDQLVSVTFYDFKTSSTQTLPASELDFAYDHSLFQERSWIILQATWRLQPADKKQLHDLASQAASHRHSSQPHGQPSAGCFWQNPPNTDNLRQLFPQFAHQQRLSSGCLIDQAGLKGYRVGDAQVSEQHAAFIVNFGHATQEEILALAHHIKATVQKKFDVILQPEVVILDSDGQRLDLSSLY